MNGETPLKDRPLLKLEGEMKSLKTALEELKGSIELKDQAEALLLDDISGGIKALGGQVGELLKRLRPILKASLFNTLTQGTNLTEKLEPEYSPVTFRIFVCFDAASILSVIRTARGFSSDAILKAEQTRTFSADSVVVNVFIKTFLGDSLLKVTLTKNFASDAILRSTQTKAFSTDAFLKETSTKAFSSDAYLEETLTKAFEADAMLVKVSTKALTADAILKATAIKAFSADAFLKSTLTKAFEADAILVTGAQTYTKAFSADAVLVAGGGLPKAPMTVDRYPPQGSEDIYKGHRPQR